MKAFFEKKPSALMDFNAPDAKEQDLAILEGRYWTVLEQHHLTDHRLHSDAKLRRATNAFKAALQTYGPVSNDLPDLRKNIGDKIKGQVWHGHVRDSNGKEFVLEWAIVDTNKRIIAITAFDSHENFKFKQASLKDAEKQKLLASEPNKAIIARVNRVREDVKKKAERIEKNYRHQQQSGK